MPFRSYPGTPMARRGLLAVAAALTVLSATASAGERPNVLLILADDLGYGDVGIYNPGSRVATPNLDRLAARGMRFTDAHSPCTVCTPTRYSLLTGQMAFRVPNGGRVFSGAGGPSLIRPGRLTLPEMLRRRGYRTACVGKWHVGLTFYDDSGAPIHDGGRDAVRRIDYSRAIDGGPLDCGFDSFFGTACCPTTDWLYAYIDGDRIPVPPTGPLDRARLPKHPYAADNRPGLVAPDFDLEEVDLKFLEKSRELLRRHVRDSPDRPFFLLHSAQAVHLPSFPAGAFRGRSGAGPHGDFLLELDHVVGELLDTLDELGVADDTLVLFTSDNGPEVPTVYHMRNDHGHDGARPWRGAKRDNWEGGHRVPLIARWPGRIPAGTTSDRLVSLTDVMATAADIVDYPLPTDAAEDSVSLLPVLTASGDGRPIRPYLLMQGFRGKRSLAVRRGDWKLLAHPGSGGNDYANHPLLREYRLPEPSPEAPHSLYNLREDPGETRNLADSEPETLRELQDLLAESLASGRSAPPAVLPPADRPSATDGSVEGVETRTFCGWTVRIDHKLLANAPEEVAAAVPLIEGQLSRIAAFLPEERLKELRRVPIWLSPPYDGVRPTAEYHPNPDWLKRNGRRPELARSIELTNVGIFERECERMPMLMLHELAHAYHHQTLGFSDPRIIAAYDDAERGGGYDAVRRGNGRIERAYAMTNPKEYFAESTEAYFGRNDFFPFDRRELKRHDPRMHGLVRDLWFGGAGPDASR